MTPKLVIEASRDGVELVTVRVRPGDRASGLELLRQTLPEIERLDQRARDAVEEPDR